MTVGRSRAPRSSFCRTIQSTRTAGTIRRYSVLQDDLRISGFMSEDGTQFVRTGAPDSPRSAPPEHDPGASPRRARVS